MISMSRRPSKGMVKVLRTAKNGGTDHHHRRFDVAACVSRGWVEVQPSIHQDRQALKLTEEGEKALRVWGKRFPELRD